MTDEVESMLVELTIGLGPFKTFVKNTIQSSFTALHSSSNNKPAPFCPFMPAEYCSDAYSNSCYKCECAVKDYLRLEEIV